MNVIIFPDKAISEVLPYTVNFADVLAFGEAISGASVTVTVFSGTDAAPAALLASATTSTATTVSQVITGGLVGVIYILAFVATGASGHVYVKTAMLACVSNSNTF